MTRRTMRLGRRWALTFVRYPARRTTYLLDVLGLLEAAQGLRAGRAA